jgi:hypothetical protein
MDHRARFSTLSASYDDFLSASVCEDGTVMRLSVLSALARMNLDPWEEAGRLAAMPKATAEKTLLLIIDTVSGRSWKSDEAAVVGARLVQLLPQLGQAAPMTSPAAATAGQEPKRGRGGLTSYWWVWLGLWVAMSFMMPHYQENTTDAGLTTTTHGATIPLKSSHLAGQSR